MFTAMLTDMSTDLEFGSTMPIQRSARYGLATIAHDQIVRDYRMRLTWISFLEPSHRLINWEPDLAQNME